MRWIFLIISAVMAFGQGTEPKPKAAEYDVHGQSKDIEIGAEFMVHSFSGEGQMFIAKDYLVVEVALYPPKGEAVAVNNGAFALRVNGKKPALLPQTPAMVAATLNRPEWQQGPRMEAEGGTGNTGVILGRPVPTQLPGTYPRRTPLPPRVPDDPPGGVEKREPVRADELLIRTALPEGPSKGPVSGFLYFAYKGKASSIKSLELVYDEAVLKLR